MIDFDNKIKAVIDIYHQRMVDEEERMKNIPHSEVMKNRDAFLLPVGKVVGEFLYNMAVSSKAKMILEIGTSYGYSTMWLAAAAKQTGGKVITLEIDPKKVKYAKDKVEDAGLSPFVDFRLGDAVEAIGEAAEQFDFVLLDIWKSLYLPCFEMVLPKLNKGAFVIADNIIDPPSYKNEMETYRNTVKATEAFDSVLLPIGSGIEVSCRR